MKKIFVLFFLSLSFLGYSQDEELFSVGTALDMKNPDSLGYKFSFGLNRVPGSEADAGSTLASWNHVNHSYFLDITSDVNLGSSTETSEDNVIFNGSFGLNRRLKNPKTGLIFDFLRPSVASNKDFNSGLLYASPGITFYWADQYENFEFNFSTGYSFDIGNRLQEKKASEMFYRHALATNFELKACTKYFDTDSSFSRIQLKVGSTLYSINGDPLVAAGKNMWGYANLSSSIEYCFTKNFGIKLAYKIGHSEPMYKKINSLEIGIVLLK